MVTGSVIVGVDCAVQAKAVGLARAEPTASGLLVADACTGRDVGDVAGTIVEWLRQAPTGLLAVDAPLGWPLPLSEELAGHRAGRLLGQDAATLFRRTTDGIVWQHVGRLPLDVGADRIARTAHAALALLAEVRARSGFELPLAWTPGDLQAPCAIEVYPAATLLSLGLPAKAYKRAAHRLVREEIVSGLSASDARVTFVEGVADVLLEHPDALDAAICAVAGADFLSGRVVSPADQALAEREGWIWFRPPANELGPS